MKPSEYTPLSVLALDKVINSVLPEGVLNIVTGDGKVGAALSTSQGIDKLMFTGSTEPGREIVESIAASLARVSLELGRHDAGLGLDGGDADAIAEGLGWGA